MNHLDQNNKHGKILTSAATDAAGLGAADLADLRTGAGRSQDGLYVQHHVADQGAGGHHRLERVAPVLVRGDLRVLKVKGEGGKT